MSMEGFRTGSRPRPLSPRQAYELLSPHYDSYPNPMIALEESALSEFLPELGGARLADIGCGTGRYAKKALEAGAERVFALDLAGGMLDVARSHLTPSRRFRTLQADMQALPLRSASLDGVLCGLALGYAARLDRALAEMARVLRKGGFIFVSDLHPLGPSLGWQREYQLGHNGHRERIVRRVLPLHLRASVRARRRRGPVRGSATRSPGRKEPDAVCPRMA